MGPKEYTSEAEFQDAYSTLNSTFATGRTKSVKWRKWQLKQLWWMLDQNQDKFVDALHKDLNRHAFETVGYDLRAVKGGIIDSLEHVDQWAKGQKPDAGFIFGTLGKAWLRKEPLGLAFVLGAWNFPLSTLLEPVVGAIAAGKSTIAQRPRPGGTF
jgi:acyl-CoA reductase-like NAD-dependent aldehyde dehydrogenase